MGGALTKAAAPPFKPDMKTYLDWAQRAAVDAPGLDVRLSTEATAEAITAERPDVLILAVGSALTVPDLPGIDRENVMWAGDARMDDVEIGDEVVIVGAGMVGCEAALDLAQSGRLVTLIDMLPQERIALDVHPISRTALLGMLHSASVAVRAETRLESITPTGVVVSYGDGRRAEIPCRWVVLALGAAPRQETVQLFDGLAEDVRVIGDCRRRGGNLHRAVTDGFNAAIDL